jgi:hypothetical protein
MKQQTVVEWLMDRLPHSIETQFSKQIEQAKEIERERIETAYDKGTVHGIDYPDSLLPLTGEHYYKQTYGGEK